MDHASLVIAVYSGVNGGTRKTIAYARQQGVPIDKGPVPKLPDAAHLKAYTLARMKFSK